MLTLHKADILYTWMHLYEKRVKSLTVMGTTQTWRGGQGSLGQCYSGCKPGVRKLRIEAKGAGWNKTGWRLGKGSGRIMQRKQGAEDHRSDRGPWVLGLERVWSVSIPAHRALAGLLLICSSHAKHSNQDQLRAEAISSGQPGPSRLSGPVGAGLHSKQIN